MQAGDLIIATLSVGGFFASVIVLTYLYFNSRNRIRLALIDQGKDVSIFRGKTSRTAPLRNGIVALMSGIGVVMGFFLERSGMPAFVAYLSMVLIFGGLGLISYYLYMRSRYPAEEIV